MKLLFSCSNFEFVEPESSREKFALFRIVLHLVEVESFIPSLSASQLSNQYIGSIIKDHEEEMQQLFRASLDLKDRLDKEKMTELFKHFNELSDCLQALYAKLVLGVKIRNTSIMQRVYSSMNSLLSQTRNDVKLFESQIFKPFSEKYHRYVEFLVKVRIFKIEEIQSDLTKFLVTLKWPEAKWNNISSIWNRTVTRWVDIKRELSSFDEYLKYVYQEAGIEVLATYGEDPKKCTDYYPQHEIQYIDNIMKKFTSVSKFNRTSKASKSKIFQFIFQTL